MSDQTPQSATAVEPWDYDPQRSRHVRWYAGSEPRHAAAVVMLNKKKSKGTMLEYYTFDVYRTAEAVRRAYGDSAFGGAWGATGNAFGLESAKRLADAVLAEYAVEDAQAR